MEHHIDSAGFVTVDAIGAPAIVRVPAANQRTCATDMRIPASISSADGAVHSVQEVDIWTESGNDASVELAGSASGAIALMAGMMKPFART